MYSSSQLRKYICIVLLLKSITGKVHYYTCWKHCIVLLYYLYCIMLKIIGIICQGLVYTQPLHSLVFQTSPSVMHFAVCATPLSFLRFQKKGGLVAWSFLSCLSDQKQEINFVWPSLSCYAIPSHGTMKRLWPLMCVHKILNCKYCCSEIWLQ